MVLVRLLLFPVCGLLFSVGGTPVADRYAYVPMIGLFVIAGWGLGDLANRLPGARIACPVAAIGMFADVRRCCQ